MRDDESLLTSQEAGALLDVSPAWLLLAFARREIPGFRLFGSQRGAIRFRLSEIRPAVAAARALDTLDKKPGPGWVYFIRNGRSGQPIKIGWTGKPRPSDRIEALQTATPAELVFLGAVRGTRADEAALHALFAEGRISRGREWFRHDTPGLVEFINAAAPSPRRRRRTRRAKPRASDLVPADHYGFADLISLGYPTGLARTILKEIGEGRPRSVLRENYHAWVRANTVPPRVERG